MEIEDFEDDDLLEFVRKLEGNVSGSTGDNIVTEDISTVEQDSEVSETVDINNTELHPSCDDGPFMAKVRQFCKDQQKLNTVKVTNRDIKSVATWLASNKFELRNLEDIPPSKLNDYLSQFVIFVRKQDGSQYQPGTLTGMIHSVDRYLHDQKYCFEDRRINILKDSEFEDVRLALQSKRRELKSLGFGNRPNRAVGVDEEEERVLWQKGVLGKDTAFSIQFTLWNICSFQNA